MIKIDFKKIRLDYNLTQLQLGKLINVSENTIRNYEQEKTSMTLEQVSLLASALNTTEEYILGIKNYNINNSKYLELCKMFNVSEKSMKKLLFIGKNNILSKCMDLFLSNVSNKELESFAKQLLLPPLDNEYIKDELYTYKDYYFNNYYNEEIKSINILNNFVKTLDRIKHSKELAEYCNNEFTSFKIKNNEIEEYYNNISSDEYYNSLNNDDVIIDEESPFDYISKEDEKRMKKRKELIEKNKKIAKIKEKQVKNKTTEINQ